MRNSACVVLPGGGATRADHLKAASMKKDSSPARAPLNDPFFALSLGPPEPWPILPAREADWGEWSKWLIAFLRQFVKEWARFETTWERSGDGLHAGFAPNHLTSEPPDFFTRAAWVMNRFRDRWSYSSKTMPSSLETFFRRIRDCISEGNYTHVRSGILRTNLHDIEGAVDRANARIATPEQSKTADGPPVSAGPSTADAGGNGRTKDPDGAGGSAEPVSFDDVPPFDQSSRKWKPTKAVARAARALKIGCAEKEVSDDQLKQAESALRTARSKDHAKRRSQDGSVCEDRDGRLCRTVLVNRRKSVYYLDSKTTGKQA